MTRNKMLGIELQLVKKIAEGDRQAFHTVYEQTYGKVARYVRGLVGNEMTAEDVVIQTYTVAWQKASAFKGTSRLTTWLIGIARNIAFKEFRKNKPHVPFDEAYTAVDDSSYREPERQDRKEKMKQVLQTLPPKQREVLELVFYQDLTYPEVSEIVGIPVNTVKTRVFHAKKAMKEKLRKLDITANDI